MCTPDLKLVCQHVCITDYFHRREHNCSHWIFLHTTAFINYQPEAFNVKFPMMTAYNNSWSLFQFL